MIKKLIIAVLFLLVSSSPVFAAMAEWNPSVGATGYEVHLGRQSGVYDVIVDVGNVTSYRLTDATYPYIVILAYNQYGKSAFSIEADWNSIICEMCDLNGDGRRTGSDYTIFKRCYSNCGEVP